jgi:lysozyme
MSLTTIDEAKMENLLKLQEGLSLKLYQDIGGNFSIGRGRNLSAKGIRLDEANLMFANDIADAENELRLNVPWYTTLSPARQAVIINMAFNEGIGGLMGFKDFLRAAEAGLPKIASQAILDSLAAKKLPARYEKLAYIYESDIL